MGNTPEHPNTTYIKELVAAGNAVGIKEVGSNLDIQLPFLVMAASHLTGDSTRIGQMLRSQTDKRGALIDLLTQLAEENAEGTPSEKQAEEQVEKQVEEQVEKQVEEQPKKRRKRRTKAEMEAARAEEAAEAQEAPIAAPAAGSVDFDRAFNDILSAIDDVRAQGAANTGDAIARLSKASDKRYDDLAQRIDRIGSALVALEEQLMMTGMILEPAVSKCFED